MAAQKKFLIVRISVLVPYPGAGPEELTRSSFILLSTALPLATHHNT